jgi:hypothetical protein
MRYWARQSAGMVAVLICVAMIARIARLFN